MIYSLILLMVLLGVGIFIGVRIYYKKKDKEAKTLKIEIGPITQK